MKAVKRIAGALRVIGIVLLFIAVAMTIYILATGTSPWSDTAAQLRQYGVNTGSVTRIEFDTAYYTALSEAAVNRTQTSATRAAAAVKHFDRFADKVNAKASEMDQQRVDEIYAAIEAMDAAAFAEAYEAREDSEEAREIAEIFEYLDNLAQPAAPKGKKLPTLKVESTQPYFEDYYAALIAEHGEEEVGEYLSFLQTVQDMIEAHIEAGNTVASASAYMDEVFTYEAYLPALADAVAKERVANESFLDGFAELMERKAAGESVDFPALFESAYATMSSRYPTTNVTYANFMTTMQGLIESPSFDGSYLSINAAAQETQKAADAASFGEYLNTLGVSVVQTADNSSRVAVVFSFIWGCVAYNWLAWVVGVALIVLSVLIIKLMSFVLLKRLADAGIEEDDDILLRAEHLKQYFRSGDYVNKAVDDVSFFIKKGEVFGLVGESGCGKTTTGRTIINLYDPTDGNVYFQGLRISSNQNGLPVLKRHLRNTARASIKEAKEYAKEQSKLQPANAAQLQAECAKKVQEIRKGLREELERAERNALESSVEKSKCVEKYREKRKAELTREYEQEIKSLSGQAAAERKARYEMEMKVAAKDNIMTRMQMIFQDPIASINPRMTVREIIAEGLTIRGIRDKKYIDEKVYEMLELVGLVREHADRYPHEFSGGQRQRIGIARAIALQPDLIIADEPISALDVSIQAQVINLLNDLRNRMGLTILFIAHNLSVVKYFSDRIAVMYFGKIVEMTTSDELFEHPLHPYTKSLLSAIPYPDPHYEKQRKRIEYNPAKTHDYTTDKPSMHEITPGHFIYCNEAELEAYRKELGL